MRTIAIVNQKGGCGKTTTTINVAAGLARLGQRVLIVDLDPQANCAAALAIPEAHIEVQVGDLMTGSDQRPLTASRLIWNVARGIDLLPSTARLAALEGARGGLADREDRDSRLAQVLLRFADGYDWCLIDNAPYIGTLAFNALRAATEVLIPVETGYFALQGAVRQVHTVKAIGRKFGVILHHRVLPTRHDAASPLAEDILCELRRRLGASAVSRPIRHDPRILESASRGVPIFEIDAAGPAALDHADFAEELLAHPLPAPQPIVTWNLDPASAPMDWRARSATTPWADPSCPAAAPGTGPEPHAEEESMPAPGITPRQRVILSGSDPLGMGYSHAMPMVNRAAELAARARGLATRNADAMRLLDADPELAALQEMREGPLSLTEPHDARKLGLAERSNLGSGILPPSQDRSDQFPKNTAISA